MPGRSDGHGKKREEQARFGTLADSFGRIPAARPSAVSGPRSRPNPYSEFGQSDESDQFDHYIAPAPTSQRRSVVSGPLSDSGQGWRRDGGSGKGRAYAPRQEPQADDSWVEAERYQEQYGDYGESDWDDGSSSRYQIIKDPIPTERMRAQSLARPLPPALPEYNQRDANDPQLQLFPSLPQESAPELMAFRPPKPRVRKATERIVASARNPWNIARAILALTAITIALLRAPTMMGEASNPLQAPRSQVSSLAGAGVTSLIKPETQLKRADLYDNTAQFYEWGDAACSAAALSEILTAYGVKGATIGHEIDELGVNISPNGGLLNRKGFALVAAKHGLRADQSTSWTFNQMVYAAQTLNIPVIVNVRISYGYYSFFSGGHFLVIVGGDSQGLAIVDSSEYYIHYLPKSVFYQMFTGYTAAIVPADASYTLPNN